MTRIFTLEDELHHGDDPACPTCPEGYPRPCRCGGLIHAEGSEIERTEEASQVATTQCDQCGRSEDDLQEEEEVA